MSAWLARTPREGSCELRMTSLPDDDGDGTDDSEQGDDFDGDGVDDDEEGDD